jgi:hypothetical protein
MQISVRAADDRQIVPKIRLNNVDGRRCDLPVRLNTWMAAAKFTPARRFSTNGGGRRGFQRPSIDGLCGKPSSCAELNDGDRHDAGAFFT